MAVSRHNLRGLALDKRKSFSIVFRTFFLALIFICSLSSPSFALTGDWDRGDAATVRLVSAVAAVGSEKTLSLGLEFKLDPTWKIYWRTPGDAGLPPISDWSSSDNVADIEMSWPVPERFEIFNIGTLGYEERVIFPLEVTLERPEEPVSLRGEIDYLICSDICIPGRASVAINVPTGEALSTPMAYDIGRFAATVPPRAERHLGLSLSKATIPLTSDESTRLAIVAQSEGAPFSAIDAFVEGPGGAYFDRPDVSLSDDGMTALLEVPAPKHVTADSLIENGVTVTLVDGDRLLEREISPQIAEDSDFKEAFGTEREPPFPSPQQLPFTYALLLALLGGMILNLMPCVLPVLSIKLLSFVEKTEQDQRDIRLGFVANSAGILFSFWGLAAAAIAVKSAGLAVGWGMQFQQPVFLAFMVALLTLFACNLLGFFEFRLPGSLADRAAAAGTRQSGFTGDFVKGAFATLLATPCSAPFLGTAVGFALGAGPAEIISVFTALGIGLALPYLMIALFPGLVDLLPRPGAWMLWMKGILAVALAGTAIWVLSVIAVSVGTENAIAIGGLALAAALALGTRRIEGSRLGARAWPISGSLAVAVVFAPLFLPFSPTGSLSNSAENAGSEKAQSIVWRPFDRAAIPGLVAEGKTVFVDVTADWCITCKWNKATVLDKDPVASWLSQSDVIAMQADWTRPDPKISEFLAEYGRYGIPFNIVYGPASSAGVPLPELLTQDTVLAAVRRVNPNSKTAAFID